MRVHTRVLALATVAALATLAASPLWLAAQAPPAGATFKCKDGTYSTSKSERGACSRHGGVAQALAAAPAAAAQAARSAAPAAAAAPAGAKFKCKDGTYSSAASPRGACSRHGGIAEALGAPAAAPAAAAAAAPSAPAAAAAAAPANAPANATALCKDGTYSMSQHRSGTCSQHGGVERWLRRPPN